jgi:hypothetical protein
VIGPAAEFCHGPRLQGGSQWPAIGLDAYIPPTREAWQTLAGSRNFAKGPYPRSDACKRKDDSRLPPLDPIAMEIASTTRGKPSVRALEIDNRWLEGAMATFGSFYGCLNHSAPSFDRGLLELEDNQVSKQHYRGLPTGGRVASLRQDQVRARRRANRLLRVGRVPPYHSG